VGLTTTLAIRADAAADEAAMTQRLQDWTAAFNAEASAGICDLFAPDLVYVLPEAAQGSRQTLCTYLDKVLARSNLQLHYDNPDVHEIIVSGMAPMAGESTVSFQKYVT
jgi:steroid delta-isomerase